MPVSPPTIDQPLANFEEAVAAAPSAAAADGSADQQNQGGNDEDIFGESDVAQPEEGGEQAEAEVVDWDVEGEKVKVAHDPKLPSEAEVEEHRLRAIGPSDVGAFTVWPPEGWACSIAPRALDRRNV